MPWDPFSPANPTTFGLDPLHEQQIRLSLLDVLQKLRIFVWLYRWVPFCFRRHFMVVNISITTSSTPRPSVTSLSVSVVPKEAGYAFVMRVWEVSSISSTKFAISVTPPSLKATEECEPCKAFVYYDSGKQLRYSYWSGHGLLGGNAGWGWTCFGGRFALSEDFQKRVRMRLISPFGTVQD